LTPLLVDAAIESVNLCGRRLVDRLLLRPCAEQSTDERKKADDRLL
jgi:hypothetical protein